MKVASSYWCSKRFGTGESPTTNIAITFPSKVAATGFRVKKERTYPMFGDYTVKVDGEEVENGGITGTQTDGDWTEYAFIKKLKGTKFELIIEKTSNDSYNYMCIKQLEVQIIGMEE